MLTDGSSWVGRDCAEPPDHGLGRSRGGFTSKLHLITDGRGRPISIGLTGGNVNDTTMLEPALSEIRVPRRGPGRPRNRPAGLLGDKGYSRGPTGSGTSRGITATIPERADQQANRARRGRKGGRPYAFDAEPFTSAATWSNAASTGSSSGVGSPPATTRRPSDYRGGVVLASVIIWLKS